MSALDAALPAKLSEFCLNQKRIELHGCIESRELEEKMRHFCITLNRNLQTENQVLSFLTVPRSSDFFT